MLQLNSITASIDKILLSSLVLATETSFGTLKHGTRVYHRPQDEGNEYWCSVENVVVYLVSLFRTIGTSPKLDDTVEDANAQKSDRGV